MFNKKLLLSALLLVSLAGVAGCANTTTPDTGDDFEQNTDTSLFEPATMYVVGSNWNSWTPATIETAEGCAFEKSADTPNCLEIDITIETSGQFKFIAGPSWSTQYGMEDVDFEKSNQAFKDAIGKDKSEFKEGTGNRSNIEISVPGSLHIEYYPLNFDTVQLDNGNTHSFKFVIEFTPAA